MDLASRALDGSHSLWKNEGILPCGGKLVDLDGGESLGCMAMQTASLSYTFPPPLNHRILLCVRGVSITDCSHAVPGHAPQPLSLTAGCFREVSWQTVVELSTIHT